MLRIIQNVLTRIPNEYKVEFSNTISKENLFKIIISSITFIIYETAIVCFFEEEVFINTRNLVISIIILNLFLLPFIYVSYKKAGTLKLSIDKVVQIIYVIMMLFYGCAMSILPQNRFASINLYIIVVFAVSAFILIHPLKYMFILFSAYSAFFFILPLYQSDTNVVAILRINTFAMNVFAWIFSRMVFRMRIITFIHKKEIEIKNVKLKDMVVRDSMTSLLNHDNSYKILHEEIKRAENNEYPLSVIMMDIDHFKHINDNFGHTLGDEIIIGVAKILVNTCRAVDFVGRYGGEEFILILPGTSLKDAVVIADRIKTIIETTNFQNNIHVTISGGVSEFNGESPEELIKETDSKLYRAKYNGRNRIEI